MRRPSHARSTPEPDRLQAQLCALLPYQTAAEVLAQMFPVNAGTAHETLRRHTYKVAEELPILPTTPAATSVETITLTLDSTYIRSCEKAERHLKVRFGDAETTTGCRQVLGAVAKTETNLAALIQRSLDAVGRTKDMMLTAFTDDCPGLRGILLDAGVTSLPTLDWFHLAMRLQHLTQIATGLSCDSPERATAKAVIVEEVERLRRRLWNGKAQDAGISLDCIRTLMHNFRGEADGRRSIAPSRKLWTTLRALDTYLTGQSDWLINYAERHRAGQQVGTAL